MCVCSRYRTIYDVLPMPWDWPVDVNYHEAKAFCKWKGPEYRVPTESEHHRMRGDPVRLLWLVYVVFLVVFFLLFCFLRFVH